VERGFAVGIQHTTRERMLQLSHPSAKARTGGVLGASR
jgi:hypothetical protein